MFGHPIVLLPACLIALAAAGYAQLRIGHQVEGRLGVVVVRAALALAGTALGALVVMQYRAMAAADGPTLALVFLTALGAVHVPAAVILHLKRLRARQVRSPHGGAEP